MKYIKKVAATPISGMAKVIDSLQTQANERKNAPSIHAVNSGINNLNDNLSEAISKTNTHLNTVDSTLSTFMSEIGAIIYPVGSIFMSVDSTSPATLFGGTWERIQDKFLLSAGSIYSAGATGGEATHTLTTQEIPSHTHNYAYGYPQVSVASGSNYYEVSNGATQTNTSATGGGQAHNNMPPYLAVYVWKRTAL